MATPQTDSVMGASPITFQRGFLPLVLFLLVSALWAVIVPLTVPPLDLVLTLGVQSVSVAVIAMLAWAALRWEAVRPSAVGLSWENVVPGLIPVAVFVVLANAVGAITTVLMGSSPEVTIPGGYSVGAFLLIGIAQVVFVGLAEEFAFRAYVQNKLIAVFAGGGARLRKVGAILTGVVLFALWHVPQRVFVMELTAPIAIAQTLISVVILGTLLGVLYEYTRNVVLVGALHGTFNWQPFVFAQSGVSVLVAGVVFLAIIWYYRRWATTARPHDFTPQQQAERTS